MTPFLGTSVGRTLSKDDASKQKPRASRRRKGISQSHCATLACHLKRFKRAIFTCVAVWKLVFGVITFKLVEAALHNPEFQAIGIATLAAVVTAFPGVALLWIGDD